MSRLGERIDAMEHRLDRDIQQLPVPGGGQVIQVPSLGTRPIPAGDSRGNGQGPGLGD